MREAHPVERTVGIHYYVSDAPGVGGRLREAPADFRVRELEGVEIEPVDADPGAYPHLVLRVTLRAWDTNDFAGALSDRLGISRERVSWAGTKDKHAITTQLFSVDGVDPADLPEFGDVDIEVVGRTGRPVLFGDLAGNEFAVVVRDPAATEHVDEVTRDLRAFTGVGHGDVGGGCDEHRGRGDEGGGSDEHRGRGDEGRGGDESGDGDEDHGHEDSAGDRGPASTEPSIVGVPNFFGHQRFGSRRPVTHEVGLALARGDWEGAVLAYVANPNEREPADTQEARAFVERTRDWGAALDRYPAHLGFERAMLHELYEAERTDAERTDADAFRRTLEAVPSNLQRLFVNAAQSYLFNRILSARLEAGLPFDRPVEGDVVCFADTDAPAGLALPDTDRTDRVTADRVATVTRHCERGRAFVTAPLVGTETTFADGEPGEITARILEEEGIAPADFDLPGEFGSTGTRRAILLRTDLSVDRDPLTLSFALPKGSYATVVLREYLKTDPAHL